DWRLPTHWTAITESCIRDDGCGFDPAAVRGGYGLAGLRARAVEVGGTAEVRSAPGDGTAVTVRLPVLRRETP
ncbi:ATP-binding protein, partial [Streptomyces sp. NPDC006386]|uniref:ATP-binding protein n=1 Tax=Streptomyces sp. NPDC006386 TaxID=3156762 RepID=UPI0033BD3511